MSDFLRTLGIADVNQGGFAGEWCGSGPKLDVITPIDGTRIASVQQVTEEEYDTLVMRAQAAYLKWREVPAPQRGQVIRQLGLRLREVKDELGALVTLEMGKIATEGRGEVQEMIDICDFATGLSRQLYGLTMHSERPRHRMYEQWHPLGVVGVISAFNFPVAVWSWNTAIAAVCGDAVLWKPASKTPLTAIACTKIAERVCAEFGIDPAIFSLVIGKGSSVGEKLLQDPRIPLVSATGSCQMGYRVGEIVGRRLGRTILELGGNNAIIVTPQADLDMTLRAILFGAVGTAGQRCTSTRRIIVHHSVRPALVERLQKAYASIKIGDPRNADTLMGPLVTKQAVTDMQNAVRRVREEGGEILYGGEVLDGPAYPGGHYVKPCIAAAKNTFAIVQEETFAPILYIIEYGHGDYRPLRKDVQVADAGITGIDGTHVAPAPDQQDIYEAIAMHNDVPQGLSSAIFTRNMLEAETFLSHVGSDCGIANVNIGTSGAEIGGAFGGEKETGGGRESGSDAWKAYMRRQTNTINWSTALPLAQGVKFGD